MCRLPLNKEGQYLQMYSCISYTSFLTPETETESEPLFPKPLPRQNPPPPPFPLCRALAAESRAPAPAASPVATLLPAGCCISPSMAFPPSPLLPSSSYSSFFSRPNSHPSPPARTPFPAASPSPL